MATEKQNLRVKLIIHHLGFEKVYEYIRQFYDDVDFSKLTRAQAQKIISGLGAKLPHKYISGVYKRDTFIRYW